MASPLDDVAKDDQQSQGVFRILGCFSTHISSLDISSLEDSLYLAAGLLLYNGRSMRQVRQVD